MEYGAYTHKKYMNYTMLYYITLRWMLEKYVGMVWSGFIWLRIENSGGLL
jgi:hypothetical protein